MIVGIAAEVRFDRQTEEHGVDLDVGIGRVVDGVRLGDAVALLAVGEPVLIPRRRGGERHLVAESSAAQVLLGPAEHDPAARRGHLDRDDRLVLDAECEFGERDHLHRAWRDRESAERRR